MQTNGNPDKSHQFWEIASNFLKIGIMAYGGPAIMGVMQNEFQEKRQWVTKERFLEGLSLVSMLPGPGATQLGIFLGYSRGGWWGGLLAGLCFMLPAFFIMLGLAVLYSVFGTLSIARSALYGLGPVVLGVFIVAVYRLGRNSIKNPAQTLISLAASVAVVFFPVGIAMILLLAGAIGILLYHSKKMAFYLLAGLSGCIIAYNLLFAYSADITLFADSVSPGLTELFFVFMKIGAFTFGGGLTVIAFVQEQVVNQYQWLTHQEFIDGLALGQFTPGPILMIAAYVGFKTTGVIGAIVCALAIFLPSFVIMLSILPVFNRVRTLDWMKAALKGIGPATIGVLAVSLLQLGPHAVIDYFTTFILLTTVVALIVWRIGPVKLMFGGAMLGVLRNRVVLMLTNKTV